MLMTSMNAMPDKEVRVSVTKNLCKSPRKKRVHNLRLLETEVCGSIGPLVVVPDAHKWASIWGWILMQ